MPAKQQTISSFFTPKTTVNGISLEKRRLEESENPRVDTVSESKRRRIDSKDAADHAANTAANPTANPTANLTVNPAANPTPILTETPSSLTADEKKTLHEKFVKKLGHPDSIARIKRRYDDEPDDDEPRKKGKLTPMEMQMLDIKRKHLDAVLIVEVGYKFKFFGEDARIAARELGIVCIPGKLRYDEHPSEAHLDRFASASIPVHRLAVHAKRLVGAGHKVGVVRQIETAALKKAGDNRNTPFVRKLTNLYTKGTYLDEIDTSPSASGHLLCITETKRGEHVDVGILAVQPATGDVVYDRFEDGFMRSEIETRLLHIAPCELLIVGDVTPESEKLVQHLSGSKTTVFGDKIRVERAARPESASSHVAQFYAAKMKDHEDAGDEQAATLLHRILELSEPVTVCLSAMITHLTEYGLEHVFDLTKYFQSFSARSHMLLNGNTLSSLEIYRNSSDYTERGSLFWALDKTRTKFGQRLLRKWVGRPLIDKDRLEERLAAVDELKDGTSLAVDRLKGVLHVKSDLERSLLRIYYKRCTRPELLNFLQALQRISIEEINGFTSPLIRNSLKTLPAIRDAITGFLDRINPEAARNDDKYAFFRENDETDDITGFKLGIASVECDLDQHRAVAAQKIKKSVTYVTVAGIEYLIEVPNTDIKNVPASWMKISGTKKVSRFHTPEVVKMVRERDQHKESLAAACDAAFTDLLVEISTQYQTLRDALQALATLDCLMSLATVASQPGYVKPTYSGSNEIDIKEGRHPMVEHLLLDSYVPNDTLLGDPTRALLITGPNMGGKSSYVRQVALISIMAQIGSYVPAASARLGLLDAVYTRMGAFDNIFAGESTFMVELSETATILKTATPRSLVILDELGRGTSTHDGVAIAHAVLDYVVRDLKCLTMFITHYQTLSAVARAFNGELKNVHMGFHSEQVGVHEEVTFLYRLTPGVSHRSYGLNVARLAGLLPSILSVAAEKSHEMEQDMQRKRMRSLAKSVGRVLREEVDADELQW